MALINRAKREREATEFQRAQFANELERTHTELLKRIQAERQRNH